MLDNLIGKPVKDIDANDGTAHYAKGEGFGLEIRTFFFRSRFKDGCILAWWSDSPWGRCRDQDRGWVVIDPRKRKIVEELQTYYFGPTNEPGAFNAWRKEQTEIHGKTKEVFRDSSGELLWSMSRDT